MGCEGDCSRCWKTGARWCPGEQENVWKGSVGKSCNSYGHQFILAVPWGAVLALQKKSLLPCQMASERPWGKEGHRLALQSRSQGASARCGLFASKFTQSLCKLTSHVPYTSIFLAFSLFPEIVLCSLTLLTPLEVVFKTCLQASAMKGLSFCGKGIPRTK